MKPTDEELYNKGLTRNESRSARGVYIGREAGQFLFDLWRNGQIKGKRAAESVEIICKMSEYIKDAQKKNDVQAMAAKLLAEGESWDCINVAIQTMAARDMEAKSGKMKQGWLFFGAGFEEELKQRGRFAARSIEFLRQKIKAGEGAQRASENAEEVARQGYTVTRKEGSEEYTLEELVRLMERFKHMASDAELMRDSLEWDGESKLDPIARYLTPERKEDMEEQMRREQEEKEREAREYLEAHVDSLFGGDMGSAQMVERNEEARAARERYAGTEAAKAVEKVVTSLRGKVKEAVTRAELEERVPVEERKGLISQEEELIMPANEGVIDAVKAATGRDVTGYYHAVSEEKIWHAVQRHSQDSTSSLYPNQLDLTWDDFALLPDILDSGKPEVEKRDGEATMIVYTKDYGNVRYKVVQKVGRKRRTSTSKLMFVTEWIQKMERGQGLAPGDARGYAPSTPLTGIQSQGGEDVKGEVSMSVAEAKERGLMKDGVMELENGVIVDGRDDFSASVRGAQQASPHLFREPDLEKVGSGEGTQSQGWGLYWSTRWTANAFYHRQFSTAGEPIAPGSKEERLMRLLGEALNVEEVDERVLYDLGGALDSFGPSAMRDELYGALESKGASEEDLDFFFDAFENMEIHRSVTDEGGFWVDVESRVDGEDMFVRINPDGKFAVNYLADLDVDDGNVLHYDEDAGRLFDEHPGLLEAYRKEGGEYAGKEKGRDIYWGLAKLLGSPRAASEWLDAHGIRGNKYEDGMSRGKKDGEKMYNYVIFNEDYIKITRINNRHPWSEYSEDNPDWQRVEDVVFGEDGEISANVIGEGAVTWEKYKKRAFKGRDDGKMRAEIDASKARLKKKGWAKYKEAEYEEKDFCQLGHLLDFPELYEAYPWLEGVAIDRMEKGRKSSAAYMPPLDKARVKRIKLGEKETEEELRRTLLHEVQHLIQQVEHFASGAGNSEMVRKIMRELGREDELPEEDDTWILSEDRKNWVYNPFGDLYERSAGEIEARNVAHRADFDERQRKWLPFNETLDRPAGEAIVYDVNDYYYSYRWNALRYHAQNERSGASPDVSAAMRRAREMELTRRVHELLLGRREEREAKAMVEAWDDWMGRFKAVMAGKEGEKSRLGRGMEAMARMVALLESTRAALPGRYRVGWLDVQLRWATWYAQMMESGEVTLSEELKDDKRYAAWAARFRDEVARKAELGVDEQGLREFLADMVGKRMDAILVNVAAKSRRTLERFLKDRARERMDDMARRLYPKRERGKAWPRGKADAATYRFVQEAYKQMDAKPGERGERGDYEAETERLEGAEAPDVRITNYDLRFGNSAATPRGDGDMSAGVRMEKSVRYSTAGWGEGSERYTPQRRYEK